MALRPPHPARTFWHENQCFTVINPSWVDFLPELRIGNPDQNLTAKDLRKAVWAISKEMAYMLRSSHSDSLLFARLSCDPRNPSIVPTGKKHFALSQTVLTTWKDLEGSLYVVSEILPLHISKIPEANCCGAAVPGFGLGQREQVFQHKEVMALGNRPRDQFVYRAWPAGVLVESARILDLPRLPRAVKVDEARPRSVLRIAGCGALYDDV